MVAKKGDVNGVKELVDKIPADKRPADVNIRDTSSGVSMKDYTIVNASYVYVIVN